MTEKEKEALEFYTEGHHCDAYDDPAAAQHFGKVLAALCRTQSAELARLRKEVERVMPALELLEASCALPTGVATLNGLKAALSPEAGK